MCASEYAEEIHAHWREVEGDMWPHADYMPRQSFVDERKRSILLDWIVELHTVAKFAPETLYLAVLLIDSYLGRSTPVNMDNLQLMGTAALVIAAKFEEIEPEDGFNFRRFYDGIYSRQQVLDMERAMLSTASRCPLFTTLCCSTSRLRCAPSQNEFKNALSRQPAISRNAAVSSIGCSPSIGLPWSPAVQSTLPSTRTAPAMKSPRGRLHSRRTHDTAEPLSESVCGTL